MALDSNLFTAFSAVYTMPHRLRVPRRFFSLVRSHSNRQQSSTDAAFLPLPQTSGETPPRKLRVRMRSRMRERPPQNRDSAAQQQWSCLRSEHFRYCAELHMPVVKQDQNDG